MADLIQARTRLAYWAPTRNRHYATLRQACLAEAGAIVKREWREGGGVGHWNDDDQERIRRNALAREIEAAFRAKEAPANG